MLELVAIWAIVGVTFFWFGRDEKQRQHARLDAKARQFAEAPHRAAARRRHEDDLDVVTRLQAHLLGGDNAALTQPGFTHSWDTGR